MVVELFKESVSFFFSFCFCCLIFCMLCGIMMVKMISKYLSVYSEIIFSK